MAGASIKEIQELAGHKTITMSARYSHLSPEHRLSASQPTATTTATKRFWPLRFREAISI
jgi:site-specific recombinase XerD